jgi:hypothetical protein
MPLQIHIQIDAINPADGSTVVLRMTNLNDPLATVQGGNTWLPVLKSFDGMEMRFFSGDFSGDTAAQFGNVTLRATSVLNDVWSTYVTDGQRLQAWVSATPGTALSTATKVFDGYAGTMERELNSYSLQLKPAAALADNPVQTATYLGTGNAEGPVELKGKVKPYGIGVCRNVVPVLVNAAKQIYHVSTTATALAGVLENGINFTTGVNRTTYAALDAAASPATGAYDYALDASLGLFIRLGAEPAGLITADFTGDLGTSAFAGTAVRLLLERAGMPAWRLNAARVTAFNTAVSNALVNRYFSDEQSVAEAIQEILMGVGGYYGFDEEGILFMGLTRIGASSSTFSHARDAVPVVKKMQQLPTSAPVWRLKMNAERVWKVHSSDEISDALKVASQNAQADADAAQADADAALLELGRIATDSWLTSSEKKTARTQHDNVTNEYADVLAKGQLFSLTTLTNAYTTAKTNLDTYLGTISPAWNDVTQDSTIVRATWISNWSGYYTARQNLMNALAVAAGNAASQTLTSIGSTAASIIGSSFKRPNSTADYNCAVVGTALQGSAIVGMAYTHASKCVMALDNDNTTTAQASQEWMVETLNGNYTIWKNGVVQVSGGSIPSTAKQLYFSYDGLSIKLYYDGIRVITVSGGGTVVPGQSYFPKWFANGRSDSIVNLTYFPGTDTNAVMDNIADDDILTRSEKLNSLQKVVADMEARYTELRKRAVTLGLSTTEVDNARNAWWFLIDSTYLPKYNDYSQDTKIYTHWFTGDTNFPTGWTLTGGMAAPTPNNQYFTLTDNSASYQAISRNQNVTGSGLEFTFGLVILKDNTPASSRFTLLRVYANGTASNSADINIDTQTGALQVTQTIGAGSHYWEIIDLGNEWLVFASILTPNAGTNNVGMDIYPAVGAATPIFGNGGHNAATTGNVVMKAPLAIQNGWNYLGRHVLVGRLAAFSAALGKLSKLISERDSYTTDWIDGPTAANILYNSTGSAIEADVELDYILKTGVGTPVTTGITASWVVLEGSLNGRTSADGAQGMTVDGNGVVLAVFASMGTPTAKAQFNITRDGILTKSIVVSLTKTYSAAVSGGGGGGGGGGDLTQQTSGFTEINTASFTTITQSLTFTMPAGKTTLRCLVNLAPKMQPKFANQVGPWNIEYKIQRGGVDQITLNSSPDPYIDEVAEGYITTTAGTMYYQHDMGSLTPGVQYTVTIVARISSGTLPTTPSGVGMNFTGSVVLSAP